MSIVNNVQLLKSKQLTNAVLFAVVFSLSSWLGTARAQEVNVNALLPIVSFILESDEVQCPSIPEAPVFTDDVPIFTLVNAPVDFSLQDIGDFIVGATTLAGAGTAADDIANALLGGGLTTQRYGNFIISTQEDIDELEGVILINGSLSVLGSVFSPELDFSPLSSLVEVTESVSISGAGNTNFNGFNCLKSVGQDLTISDNLIIESISGFQSLETVRSLQLLSNQNLKAINGFSRLESVGLDLVIVNNTSLEGAGSLAALNSDEIGGDINITENISFNCDNPAPNFLPATFSTGNAVNCAQDLASRIVSAVNLISMPIPELGSVSSSIAMPDQAVVGGVVRGLMVFLDITHPSVGDLTVTLSNGTTSINLIDRPTTPANEATILADITSNCIDTPLDSGFLDNVSDGQSVLFDDFISIDPDCAVGYVGAPIEGGGELCTSNDIFVLLIDNDTLLPINSSCSSAGSDIAFPGLSIGSPGVFSPLEALSAFNGSDVNETWTLTVTDSEGGNTGTLNSWAIQVDVER